MEIRIRKTGQVMFENEFRSFYPNTSFPVPLTSEIINDFDADVLLEGPQPIAGRYQTVYRNGVEQINGQWYTKYSIAEMDSDSKAAKDSRQADAVRSQRNANLAASDWTQLADSVVDKTVWATYRQALRDVPSQSGFPWDMTWPTAPGA